MDKKIKLALLIALPLMGVVAGYLLMGRTIQVSVNGVHQEIHTRALTVGGALRSAGFQVQPGDRVTPSSNTWLSKTQFIEYNSTSTIHLWVDPDGEIITLNTPALTPQEILAAAGIEPSERDEVLVNGQSVPLDKELERYAGMTLQYRPAVEITLTQEGEPQTIFSAAPTLGLALWQQGIRVGGGDRLTADFALPLQQPLDVALVVAHPIEIKVDGVIIHSISAAETVGEAVKSAGISLQDLDYTRPSENEPLPADGKIQVVRVIEKIIQEQSAIPYETERVADDSMEINQEEVIEAGREGIKASRIRVRYEDGEEVSRTHLEDVVLVEPVNRVVHYGSQIVEKTLQTPDGIIKYYMAVNVIATSYSPCRSGVEGRCYTGTALGIPVQKGVVGMHRAWYNIFKGTQIYVPGYGVATVADIGYYPYSDYWVDLGYTDADYEPWYSVSTTIYFLSPPPAGFTGVLP
ncbi:MAG: DUF348 domain-containing protein [Anaerolineaceae bacterium]|nr:DUF348 domain-containing protein [Anaerolineaceae bacterium]